MKFFIAKERYKHIQRSGWVGQFVDSDEHGLLVHRLPGLDTELTSEDILADDWSEFHIPDVGSAVI